MMNLFSKFATHFRAGLLVGSSFFLTYPCNAYQDGAEIVGRIELVEYSVVAAKDPGIVREVLMKPGTQVEPGDVLLRLDHESYSAQLEVAERQKQIAELESKNKVDLLFAVKSQEVSQKVLERSENANSIFDKSISLSEIDRLRLEMEKAELSAEQAEHTREINRETLALRVAELNLAKQKLNDRQVTSPISGVVVQQMIQPGEFLQPGQAAIRIISLDRLRAVFRLPDSKVNLIKTGTRVNISIEREEFPGTVEGKVVFVSPETDSVQRDVLIWAEFDNANGALRPGEPCRVQVLFEGG